MLLLVSSASLSSASVNSLLAFLLLLPGLALQLDVKEDRLDDFPVKQGEYDGDFIAECFVAGLGVSESDNFFENAATGVCGSADDSVSIGDFQKFFMF